MPSPKRIEIHEPKGKYLQERQRALERANAVLLEDPRCQEIGDIFKDQRLLDQLGLIWKSWKIKDRPELSHERISVTPPEVRERNLIYHSEPYSHSLVVGPRMGDSNTQIEAAVFTPNYSRETLYEEIRFSGEDIVAAAREAMFVGGELTMRGAGHTHEVRASDSPHSISFKVSGADRFSLLAYLPMSEDGIRLRLSRGSTTNPPGMSGYSLGEEVAYWRSPGFSSIEELADHLAERMEQGERIGYDHFDQTSLINEAVQGRVRCYR
jgi:hypothetical protein